MVQYGLQYIHLQYLFKKYSKYLSFVSCSNRYNTNILFNPIIFNFHFVNMKDPHPQSIHLKFT